ncbi:hypothetical protein B0H11DRAFT_1915077 [Mycena galericulata]|nr:hypothetical protein B0H11DRAFT_1915077 [Mycena galericulata]
MSEAATSHTAPTATPSTSAAAPQAAQAADTTPQSVPQTQPQAEAETEPPVEHKKHGIAGLVEKIVHPIHGSHHQHSHTDTVSVPVAVPKEPSDGPAHLAVGGNSVAGIM